MEIEHSDQFSLPTASNTNTAPIIYADGVEGFMGSETMAVVKMNLFTVVQHLPWETEIPPEMQKIVTARLVMPREGAKQLAAWIKENLG